MDWNKHSCVRRDIAYRIMSGGKLLVVFDYVGYLILEERVRNPVRMYSDIIYFLSNDNLCVIIVDGIFSLSLFLSFPPPFAFLLEDRNSKEQFMFILFFYTSFIATVVNIQTNASYH